MFTMGLIWTSIIYFESQALISNLKQNNDERSRNSMYDNDTRPTDVSFRDPSDFPSSTSPSDDFPSSTSQSDDFPSSE